MIQTETLQIVIGVAKSIGDPLSAEQGIQVYPLVLKNPSTGLTLDSENLWQPGRPALKNGGQWNNSSLVDGRTLSNDVVDNVTETIQLIATAQDMRGLATLLATLQRFVLRARQFSATNWQIEPVYLEWSALNGYGSQYALIYDIQMDVRYDQPNTPQTARVTLVIEREPAWRGLPPGVSPRVWTKYAQGKIPGKNWDYTNIAFEDSGALFEVTVQNRTEFTESTDDYDYPSVSKNWAELDSSLIPGDAPALAAVTVDISQYTQAAQLGNGLTLYAALSSKPHSLPQRGNATHNRQRIYQLNCIDAESDNGTPTVTTDNTDGVKDAASANIRVLRDGGGLDLYFPSPVAGRRLSYAMQRGKYAAFLRAKYVSGDAGVTEAQLTVRASDSTLALPAVDCNFPSTNPYSAYLGTFALPFTARTVESSDGIGQAVNSNNALASTFEVVFDLAIDSPGIRDLIDMTLIPIDESIARFKLGDNPIDPNGAFTPDVNYITMDSTGYVSRGQDTQFILTGTQLPSGSELIGTDLLLTPGVDNFLILYVTGRGVSGIPRDNFSAKVDIVPRWYGVRDA